MTAWTDYVKQYAKENNLSYKEAMKQAKLTYRKVKLNIIEDDPVESPATPKVRKIRKPRKVILDIQESPLPSLISKTEEELNKTSIPKLKEMLKELNFTKFAKFKKQDYVDKILELKNIPKGVWWRYKYPWLYENLKRLNDYLDDKIIYNIKHFKRALLKENDKLEELKKSNLTGEQRQTKFRFIKDQIERYKEFIKEFDDLSNFDFEKEVEKLEKEAADRKKKFDDANKEPEPTPTPEVVPTKVRKVRKPRKVKLIIEEDEPTPAPTPTPVISASSDPLSNPQFLKEKKDLIERFSIKKKQIANQTEDDPTLRQAQFHILQYQLKAEYKKLTDKYTGKTSAKVVKNSKPSKPSTISDID